MESTRNTSGSTAKSEFLEVLELIRKASSETNADAANEKFLEAVKKMKSINERGLKNEFKQFSELVLNESLT